MHHTVSPCVCRSVHGGCPSADRAGGEGYALTVYGGERSQAALNLAQARASSKFRYAFKADSTRHLKATCFGASHRENASDPEYMTVVLTFSCWRHGRYGERGTRRGCRLAILAGHWPNHRHTVTHSSKSDSLPTSSLCHLLIIFAALTAIHPPFQAIRPFALALAPLSPSVRWLDCTAYCLLRALAAWILHSLWSRPPPPARPLPYSLVAFHRLATSQLASFHLRLLLSIDIPTLCTSTCSLLCTQDATSRFRGPWNVVARAVGSMSCRESTTNFLAQSHINKNINKMWR